MNFKVDENLPTEAVRLLQDSGHDATSVLEQGLGGHPDPEIATVCQSEKRILITLDGDFGNIRSYPPGEHSGIIVIRLEHQGKQNVLSVVSRLLTTLESSDVHGALWIVEENRIRIRGTR